MVKIFAKVLANRVAPELLALVGLHQSAFVRGRVLLDNFMLMQGTARRIHALRELACLVKLDTSKAFDTVDWSFLLQVLRKIGFGRTWFTWICGLLSIETTRVHVNGTPGSTLSSARGLMQGDPLSPMLLILVMEALHHMFQFAA